MLRQVVGAQCVLGQCSRCVGAPAAGSAPLPHCGCSAQPAGCRRYRRSVGRRSPLLNQLTTQCLATASKRNLRRNQSTPHLTFFCCWQTEGAIWCLVWTSIVTLMDAVELCNDANCSNLSIQYRDCIAQMNLRCYYRYIVQLLNAEENYVNI